MADQVIDVNPPAVGRREVLIKQISWAAVFSGALVALAVGVLFLTFGSFVGFRMVPGTVADAWSVGWTFFGAFISFLIGGWVAGRLSGNPAAGRTHGLVTWGLATVATFAFIALVSWGVVSQTVGVVKTAALAASNMATNLNGAPTAPAPGNRGTANRMLEQQANQALNQAQSAWPYQARSIANQVSNFSLFIWIAFMLAAIGALIGGAAGAPKFLPEARL